jgi:ATP adenylyltransferase
MTLERLWAGWRHEYITQNFTEGTSGDHGCVLCRIFAEGDEEASHVLVRGATVGAALNAYPYTSGHLMVAPLRHVGNLEDLTSDEGSELWAVLTDAVVALKSAYRPAGLNVGINLGRVAGAGVPDHLHLHALPRWDGDTNFMTTVAEARVLPEALGVSWDKLKAAWPK